MEENIHLLIPLSHTQWSLLVLNHASSGPQANSPQTELLPAYSESMRCTIQRSYLCTCIQIYTNRNELSFFWGRMKVVVALLTMFPGTSPHVCLNLFLFVHVGVHIVYLAASVLSWCIITAHILRCMCAYMCVCVCVLEWTRQIQPIHNI